MPNIYDARERFKRIFIAISVAIVAIFLYVSNRLVEDLSIEERNRMEIWAEATRIAASADPDVDLTLVLEILKSNSSIPVVIVDEDLRILYSINTDKRVEAGELITDVWSVKDDGKRIVIPISESINQYLFYQDSLLLTRLSLYPYVLMLVMIIFLAIIYYAVLSTKRAEQNKVWVGLSKETAHQLGTPISSLMAWVDLLALNDTDPKLLAEMQKDVARLSVIADRFSKIGSQPEMVRATINETVQNAIDYMGRRISGRVKLTTNLPDNLIDVEQCPPLIEWVVENLFKNAIDAMGGEGSLNLTMYEEEDTVKIEITDTGKGIYRKNFKTVFSPGYTTKKRGWGLGLTLVKRIIEEYHSGKVYVKESEIDKGTTFCIELKTV